MNKRKELEAAIAAAEDCHRAMFDSEEEPNDANLLLIAEAAQWRASVATEKLGWEIREHVNRDSESWSCVWEDLIIDLKELK